MYVDSISKLLGQRGKNSNKYFENTEERTVSFWVGAKREDEKRVFRFFFRWVNEKQGGIYQAERGLGRAFQARRRAFSQRWKLGRPGCFWRSRNNVLVLERGRVKSLKSRQKPEGTVPRSSCSILTGSEQSLRRYF